MLAAGPTSDQKHQPRHEQTGQRQRQRRDPHAHQHDEAHHSTDHRAVDGALGAELMVAFKRYIENPMGMLV